MAINTKLELRQAHGLVMTPQLQQAIKLLQLSNMELATFVEGELERNPLLEQADADEPSNTADQPSPAAKSEEGSSEATGAESGTSDEGDWVNLETGNDSGRTDDLDELVELVDDGMAHAMDIFRPPI